MRRDLKALWSFFARPEAAYETGYVLSTLGWEEQFREPVSLSISGDLATIKASASREISGGARGRVGLWDVATAGDDLRFTLDAAALGLEAATVDARVVGMGVASTVPAPERDDGQGLLTWTLGNDPASPEIAVEVIPPPDAVSLLRSTTPSGSRIVRWLRRLGELAPLAALLLAARWAVPKPPKDARGGAAQEAAARLRRVAVGLLVLFAVPVAVRSYSSDLYRTTCISTTSSGERFVPCELLGVAQDAVAYGLPAVALPLLFWAGSSLTGRQKRVVAATTAAATVVALAWVLIREYSYELYRALDPEQRSVVWVWRDRLLLLLAAVVALVAWLYGALFLSGVARGSLAATKPVNGRRAFLGCLALIGLLLGLDVKRTAEFFAPLGWGDSTLILIGFGRDVLYVVWAMSPLVVLALLAGVVAAERTVGDGTIGADGEGPSRRLMRLLFAAFVVGLGAVAVSGVDLPIAFLVALVGFPLVLRTRWDDAERAVAELNPGLAAPGGPPLLQARQQELLERAQALERVERRLASLAAQYAKGELDGPDYAARRDALEADARALRTGDGPPNAPRPPAKAEPKARTIRVPLPGRRVEITLHGRQKEARGPRTDCPATEARVRLPANLSPARAALAPGPGQNRWDNGVRAMRVGAVLSILPLAFFVHVLLSEQLVRLVTEDFGRPVWLLDGLARQAAFWLAAAFVLGALYPSLLGPNGAAKGAALSLVYAGTWLVVGLVDGWPGVVAEPSNWVFRWLELLLFLVAVGVAMDAATLRKHGIDWRRLDDLYQLHDARSVVGYLAPLVGAALVIGQQILSGEAQGAIAQIVENLPRVIPPAE